MKIYISYHGHIEISQQFNGYTSRQMLEMSLNSNLYDSWFEYKSRAMGNILKRSQVHKYIFMYLRIDIHMYLSIDTC